MKKFTDVVNENKVVENNDKIIESIDTERISLINEIAGTVMQHLDDLADSKGLNIEEKDFLMQTVIDNLSDTLQSTGPNSHDTSNDKDKTILDMENVHTVPEAKHVLTAEDIEKINQYLINELQESDVETHLDIENLGLTLEEASNNYPDYEDETLQHFILALFSDKYYGEY